VRTRAGSVVSAASTDSARRKKRSSIEFRPRSAKKRLAIQEPQEVLSSGNGETKIAPDQVTKKKARKAGKSETKEAENPRSNTKVHRCRFIDWEPKAISAMSANDDGSLLALSRNGGAIEIWHVVKRSFSLAVFVPGQGRDDLRHVIVTLCWCEPRLFGGDLEGNLFEVDLIRQERTGETTAFGGAVWCVDANFGGNMIAVGCEDGRVRLFDVLQDGLEYSTVLRSASSGRVLAVKWLPSEANQHILYASGVDGLIRKWNTNSGMVEMEISTDTYGKNYVCLWSLAVLPDFTVFTGDSEGHVNVWDTSEGLGSLIASFHEHRADVTTLVTARNNQGIFASGIDSRVAFFQLVKPSREGDVPTWVYSYSHRPHSHDVRGLAIVDGGRLLASGGNDTQICWYPVASFSESRPSRVSPFRHDGVLHIGDKGNMVLAQHEAKLELWHMNTSKKFAEIKFQDRLGIRCSALSENGQFCACADANGIKLFRIGFDAKTAQLNDLKRLHELEKNVMLASNRNDGAVIAMDLKTVQNDYHFVCLFQSGLVAVSVFSSSDLKFNKTGFVLEKRKSDVGCKIALSSNGKWLACATFKGSILIVDVAESEIHCEFTSALLGGSNPVCMRFKPDKQADLVIATMDNAIWLYNTREKKLADWTQRYVGRMDPRLLKETDTIAGITFDPADPDSAVVWARGFICKINFAKVARGEQNFESGSLNFDLRTKYRTIVGLGYSDAHELVISEADWFSLVKNFAQPLAIKRFGGAN